MTVSCSGAEQAVLLVAVDSFVSPVLLAERGHVWSRWLRNSPPLAEAAAAVVVSTPAAAQDPEPPRRPEITLEEPGVHDHHEEMHELLLKIERRLAEIDELLFEASAGEVDREAIEEAGAEDLLELTIAKSEENLRDIDRLLELADEGCDSEPGGS